MAPYDHPSVPATTPGSHAGRRGGSFHSSRNYKIAHQRVTIDVDLENSIIKGSTEIVVTPTEPVLKFIRLDCRQMEVTDVLVNNRRVDYLHLDPLNDEFKEFTHQSNKKSLITDIQQHHLYKNNFKKIFNGDNSEELTIFMPERLKLTLNDQSANTGHFTPSYRDSPGSHRPLTSNDITYSPVLVKVDFIVRNPQNGVHFAGGKGSTLNKSEWHAYTNNSNYGISTSSWLPCIDSLWEKCSWEVEISVPRTVKDIGCPRLIGSITKESKKKDDEDDEDEEEGDESAEILVIGADYANQKEGPHLTDLSKKVVSYEIFNPTSAHHLGWSVGAFIQCPLINLQEEEEPESSSEKDTTQVPSSVYCMPSLREDAINTTIFLYKTIDFYSREFGSFPYTSNAIVFVSDIDVDYAGFGGVTMFNEKLLYPTNEIEPLYPTTFILSVALAEQWSGINVVPKTYNDLWVTIGIAHFMAFQFIKKLMGVNEFKFRIKKQSDLICEKDVNQRPLASPFLKHPISVKDLDFLKLKAPIVLFILDRRMTKTDKSFGLYRVIPKIFLQAMSGDLFNGCLSTYNFQHVCEKVNHNRLDPFFRQWVYGSGVPIFRVTQRFNKKRMFIEMGIRQVQQNESPKYHPSETTFISDAKQELEKQMQREQAEKDAIQPPASQSSNGGDLATLFTGPMTIRIHEADGTPYEHIVDLKEGFTKLDIQYNTKYKRLKRNKKKTDKQDGANTEEEENVLLHCLGDTLQSDQEIKDWELTDWTKEEEERMSNEAFEWIRIDADFEWICKIHINQPDYMFASQLQQDRDIEAQLDSVNYFANSNPSSLYSSILLRTLMDSRYYYGVRVEAALGLAKLAKPQVKYIGKTHLLKTFRHLFCFPYSPIPLPNNFVDFPLYFIKKAIPKALSTIKDANNNVPIDVRNFLLNLLKYNENMNNPYSDEYYIGHLIQCISHTLLANPLIEKVDLLSDTDKKLLDDALNEISRHQKLDEWASVSEQKIGAISMTEKLRLARRGLYEFDVDDLLNKTQTSYSDNIRVLAFEGLFAMGALKNETLLKYFFASAFFEKSYAVKIQLIEVFVLSIGRAALHGFSKQLDESDLTKEIVINLKDVKKDQSTNNETGGDGFVVVEEGNNDQFESRKDALARSSLKGSIELLRKDLLDFKPFIDVLWESVKHPLLTLSGKRELLDVIGVLIQGHDTLTVKFEIPRAKKIGATNLGKGKILFKREGQFKISIPKKLIINTGAANANGNGPTVTVKAAKTPKTPIAVTTGKTKVAIKISKPLKQSTETEVKPEAKPEANSEVKSEVKPEVKSKVKSEVIDLEIPDEPVKPVKTIKAAIKAVKTVTKPLARTTAQGSPKKLPKFKSEIRRTKSGPLRYIRISTNRRLVCASSDPFRRKKGTGAKAKLSFNKSAPSTTVSIAEVKAEAPEVCAEATSTAQEPVPTESPKVEATEEASTSKEITETPKTIKSGSESPVLKVKSESPVERVRGESPAPSETPSNSSTTYSSPKFSKPLPTSPKGNKQGSPKISQPSPLSTSSTPKSSSSNTANASSSSTNFKKFSLKPGPRQPPSGPTSYNSPKPSPAPSAYSRVSSRAASPSPSSSSQSHNSSSKNNDRPYSKPYQNSHYGRSQERSYDRERDRDRDFRDRDRDRERDRDRDRDRERERSYTSKPSHSNSPEFRHRSSKPSPPSQHPRPYMSKPSGSVVPPPTPPPPHGKPPPPPPPHSKPPPLPAAPPREGCAPPAPPTPQAPSPAPQNSNNNGGGNNGPPKPKLKLKFKF